MDFELRPEGRRRGEGPTKAFTPPPGKVPPHNIEAEMNVLGGILLDNRSLDSVYEIGLTPEDFYQESHQKIFRSMLELAQRGQPADAITIKNSLLSSGQLEKVGGAGYIAELVGSDYSVANLPAYGLIVKEKSIERKIIQVCSEQAALAYEGVVDHSAFKEETEKKVLDATSERKLSTYSSLSESMLEVFNHLQDVASRNTKIIGVPSGFRDLDAETRVSTGARGDGGAVFRPCRRPAPHHRPDPAPAPGGIPTMNGVP